MSTSNLNSSTKSAHTGSGPAVAILTTAETSTSLQHQNVLLQQQNAILQQQLNDAKATIARLQQPKLNVNQQQDVRPPVASAPSSSFSSSLSSSSSHIEHNQTVSSNSLSIASLSRTKKPKYSPISLAAQVRCGQYYFNKNAISLMSIIIRAALKSYTQKDAAGSDASPPSGERRQQLIEFAEWLERMKPTEVGRTSDFVDRIDQLHDQFGDLTVVCLQISSNRRVRQFLLDFVCSFCTVLYARSKFKTSRHTTTGEQLLYAQKWVVEHTKN